MGYRKDRKLIAKHKAQELREAANVEKEAVRQEAQALRPVMSSKEKRAQRTLWVFLAVVATVVVVTALKLDPPPPAPTTAPTEALEAPTAPPEAPTEVIELAPKIVPNERFAIFFHMNLEAIVVIANREVCQYRSLDGFKGGVKMLMYQSPNTPSYPQLTPAEKANFNKMLGDAYTRLIEKC